MEVYPNKFLLLPLEGYLLTVATRDSPSATENLDRGAQLIERQPVS